jgi:hypothetical protein
LSSRRGQKIGNARIAPFSYITHETMRALQGYFEGQDGAKLSTGIALYMGIAFLLSSEEKDGEHSGSGQWTRAEITKASGVSAPNVTRYAEHLENAGVIDVTEDTKGGQGAHFWRLIEPAQGGEASTRGGEAPDHHDEAPDRGDEAFDGEKKTTEEDEQPPLGVPPEKIERALKFCRWLSQQADEEPKPSYPASQIEAAIELIEGKPKEELAAVVKWAHTRPSFWPSRVRTAGRLRQYWDDARSEWRGSLNAGANGNGKDAERRARTEARLRGESL